MSSRAGAAAPIVPPTASSTRNGRALETAATAASALGFAVSPGTLAADAHAGLRMTPKQLPSKYLYDPLGSALFEAICRLPWYEVTRAEQRLLDRYGAAIVEAANPRLIVELGPGSGDKLATLVSAVPQTEAPLHLHLIDISPAALDRASRTVGYLPHTQVTTNCATY
jgi:L-histidine Nalpha-methyltransferase